MKRRLTLTAIAVSFLLAFNAAEAGIIKIKPKPRPRPTPAPEISMASGTGAIALLAGALLLAGERVRTRRS